MSRHTAFLTLRIKGPVLSAGLDSAAFGVDDANLLAADRSTVIIPESLVRGNVVHVLREMSEQIKQAGLPERADLEKVRTWFGSEPAHDSYLPHRRRIRFDDLALVEDRAVREIVRIKLDPETGSVEHGAMQIVESPLDYGEEGTFKGNITFALSQKDADLARDWIEKALAFVPAIGALKSSGFGRITDRGVSVPVAATSTTVRTPPSIDTTFRYALKLDRPFLVASQAISGNLFKGAIDIPGAVIKGAIADQLQHASLMTGTLQHALDKLVFRHAKPAASTTAPRPRSIPLSLYACDGTLKDALVDCPVKAGADGAYVEFKPDWKDSSDIDRLTRSNAARTFAPRYDIRTRTAVGDGSTAADEKLFTRMAVEPADHVWIGEIVRPDNASDADLKAILDALSGGIHGFGKTRANATLEWLAAAPRTAAPVSTSGTQRTWRIVLETDALLHGPGDETTPLDQHYFAYFQSNVGASLTGLTFYAAQRWVGGYQVRRFLPKSAHYYPNLVTLAGSVFQFTCDAACDAKIVALAGFGLPLPTSVGTGCNFQYERSAFNRENGYGEVSIEARTLTSPVGGT